MLGHAVVSLLLNLGIVADTPPLATLDLAKDDTIALGVGPQRRLVINCTAYTNIDSGRKRAKSWRPRSMGRALACWRPRARKSRSGTLLVTYSTDYVFNGVASSPYRTDQTLDPLNAYGRSKAVGEQASRRPARTS